MKMRKLLEIDRRQLGIGAFLVITFSTILINSVFVSSPIVGTIASVIYFILVGYLLGKVFFGDDEEGFMRFIFGVFLLISLFILVGTPVVVFYHLNVLGLAVVLCVPLILLASYAFYLRLRGRNFRRNRSEVEKTDDVPYFSPVYIVFAVLFACSVFLLVESRSGWVYGPVWSVVSPSFFLVYFLTTFVLIGILLYSRTRRVSKMLLTIAYSLLSSSVFALVLYPGNFGDPFSHMAWARMLLNHGNLRVGYSLSPFTYYLLLKEKGLALIVAIFTKMFTVDVYWVHTFIMPVLWGVFVPPTAYKMAKIIGLGERVSWLAAFLITFNPGLIEWGSRSVAVSLGFIFFFGSLYFSLWYLKIGKTKILLLGAVGVLVSGLAHPFTGIMSVSFLFLAFTLKIYYAVKAEGRYKIGMTILPFLICVVILPFTFLINNFVYLNFAPAGISLSVNVVEFSFEKLVETDVWALIFGEYVVYSFKDLVFSAVVPFLGIVGFGYTLSRRKKYSQGLTLFMFSAFIICLIHYRFLQYVVVNPIFGPGRVWTLRDLIAIPFAALAINLVAEFLERGVSSKPVSSVLKFKRWAVGLSARHIIAGVVIGLTLSAFASSSIDTGYMWLKGLQPTQLEVEAIKYLDEYTEGRYVVVTMPVTATVGRGFLGASLGLWNPEKYYLYDWTLGANPSLSVMYDYMKYYEATVAYFMASSFRTPDFDKVVADASEIFVPLRTLDNENGEIRIFQIKLPPFPLGSDVNAFYWDIPPGYIVQNHLMRVVFNERGKSLDVVDHWGHPYESLDLNETLIDGKPLGNLTSIERYSSPDGTWVEWDKDAEALYTNQFKFKLNFESGSLIVVVESGESSVELSWESAEASILSVQLGDFSRLYIPGLVGGEGSYELSSQRYGLLYTVSRNNEVTLLPAYNYEEERSSLTFSQIVDYCNFTVTEGYFSYDLYVQNKDEIGQWAYIEVWLPDAIYESIFAVMRYSPDDGESWSGSVAYTDYPTGEPIETLGGALVNWGFSRPGNATETPVLWRTYDKAIGGSFALPPYFTASGGGQNRILFGLYLPAKDTALLRLGASIYDVSPRKVTYVFTDSDNSFYGLRNMEEGLIKFYNDGYSVYVGGLASTEKPTSLAITEDEGRIEALTVSLPSNSSMYLLSAYGINTRIDQDNNGIPDLIEK